MHFRSDDFAGNLGYHDTDEEVARLVPNWLVAGLRFERAA
jgi:hypothetical protein